MEANVPTVTHMPLTTDLVKQGFEERLVYSYLALPRWGVGSLMEAFMGQGHM